MTLEDLLYTLRQRLVELLEKDAREDISNLLVTFGVLRDASFSYPNRELSGLLEDFVYSGQHGVMGFKHQARAAIPTVEAIKAACSSAQPQP